MTNKVHAFLVCDQGPPQLIEIHAAQKRVSVQCITLFLCQVQTICHMMLEQKGISFVPTW